MTPACSIKSISKAIAAHSGHRLREVLSYPEDYEGVRVLTGTIFANTGLEDDLTGALSTVIVPYPISWGLSDKWVNFPMPLAICHEPWIRREINWHAFSDGRLCWEIPHKWFNELNQVHKLSSEKATEFASIYFINSTSWLIGRHKLGELFNLTEWQKNWDQWKHYGEGVTQYYNEQRSR